MKLRLLSAVTLAAGLTGAAMAGPGFINGDFETGVLSPWVVTPTQNGRTLYQDVVSFDVTGTGASLAGHFGVGQVNFQSGVQEGVSVTQMLNLSAGTEYTFRFNWAAHNTGTGGNAQGGVFSLVINGQLFGTQAAGSIAAGQIIRGTITVLFTPGSSGQYDVGARITRPFTPPGTLHQYIDNFTVDPIPAPGALALLGLAGLATRRRRRD